MDRANAKGVRQTGIEPAPSNEDCALNAARLYHSATAVVIAPTGLWARGQQQKRRPSGSPNRKWRVGALRTAIVKLVRSRADHTDDPVRNLPPSCYVGEGPPRGRRWRARPKPNPGTCTSSCNPSSVPGTAVHGVQDGMNGRVCSMNAMSPTVWPWHERTIFIDNGDGPAVCSVLYMGARRALAAQTVGPAVSALAPASRLAPRVAEGWAAHRGFRARATPRRSG